MKSWTSSPDHQIALICGLLIFLWVVMELLGTLFD
jgi:hypothetical protein